MKINTFTFAIFKKLALLAPGSGRCSPPRGLVSYSSSCRSEDLSSTLVDSGGCSYITFAWCHSLLEFNSSPRWLEIKVPSSTSLVNGFL